MVRLVPSITCHHVTHLGRGVIFDFNQVFPSVYNATLLFLNGLVYVCRVWTQDSTGWAKAVVISPSMKSTVTYLVGPTKISAVVDANSIQSRTRLLKSQANIDKTRL